MDVNVKVAVRCRPISKSEKARNCENIVTTTPTTVTLHADNNERSEVKTFTYDHCYFLESTQDQVYNDLGKGIVLQAFEGYNGTLFAYGQTGSGKTHTMMGTPEERGIIPRINSEIIHRVKEKLDQNAGNENIKYRIMVSYLEIYNEKVKDLLNPIDEALKISEHPEFGFYVKDLCELIVKTDDEILALLEQGNAVRKVAATQMNQTSSRSHSVFTITLEHKTLTQLDGGLTREQTLKAKINLVDLAGSERAAKTGAVGLTLKEGAKINLSLMTLGTVINGLAAGDKKAHIPYRDSALTKLLKESLGGNAATVMIAAISPADYNYDETLSTLKYATRAKSIENTVSKNEDNNDRMIRELKETIEKLKQELTQGGKNATSPELEEKLAMMKKEQNDVWNEKEKLSLQLEQERQANMSNVISTLMTSVKEEKLNHMKKIKLLQIEQKDLKKKQTALVDENELFKKNLDDKMKLYNRLQQEYDQENKKDFTISGEETTEELKIIEQRKAEKEGLVSKMALLLDDIEKDRIHWTDRRDQMRILKANINIVDTKIDEAKAELIVTHNILDQNNRMKEQIITEEKVKLQEQMDKELNEMKIKLEQEKANVRGTVEAEIGEEMSKLKQELSEAQNALKQAKKEDKNKQNKINDMNAYIDKLEERLVDAEALHETAEQEISMLKGEVDYANSSLTLANTTLQELRDEMQQLDITHRTEIANKNIEFESDFKRCKETQENEKYLLFKGLMDTFSVEKSNYENKISELQKLLTQATKDLLFVISQNEELQKTMTDIKYQDRDIIPSKIKK